MFNRLNDNTHNSISYEDYFFTHSSMLEELDAKDEYDEIIPSHTPFTQGWIGSKEINQFNGNDYNGSGYSDFDTFVTQCQSEVKLLYFNSDFNMIQNKLEWLFPHFFEVGNYSFLYFIRKLIFFKLLQLDNTYDINSFYFNELFPILREVKPKEWKTKHKVFLQLIRSPSFFRKTDFLKKYYDQFQYELEKAIREFLAVHFSKKQSKASVDLPFPRDEQIGFEANGNIFSSKQQQQEMTELSTKEEFSDFEEEFENKECNAEQEPIQSESKYGDQSIGEEVKSKAIEEPRQLKKSKKGESLQSKLVIKPKPIKGNLLLQQLPFLTSFKPTYAKRETIDKKILRTFRQYIIDQHNSKEFLTEQQLDPNFWILFINGNILPPLNYYDNNCEEVINFKSFNSSFLLWFFSKAGIKEVYEAFSKHDNGSIITKIVDFYKIEPKDKDVLHYYIINLPFIFDISLVSKSKSRSTQTHEHKPRRERSRENSETNLRQMSDDEE